MTRHLYDVPGWGVGELWVREGIVIQHELPSEELRAELERAGVPVVPDGAAVAWSGADTGPGRSNVLPPAAPNGGARLPARTLPRQAARDRAGFVPELCRRVSAHLAGVPTDYADVPIDLDWATPLQRDFALAARAVSWGEVVSYGELAALAGRPRAARAAGSFCAENRYSLIVPCHRIVAADGIGGYGEAGPALKRRLLALEGIRL